MYRITRNADAEIIAAARMLIPDPILDLIAGTHWLTSSDPLFVGLHGYQDTTDGRSYRGTAHTAYPFHTSDGTTTIVLPRENRGILTAVHEMGHALDHALGFQWDCAPVTDYARVNRREGFAEAFCEWLFYYGDDPNDAATTALFDRLADGDSPYVAGLLS